jgi:hypothetical protein
MNLVGVEPRLSLLEAEEEGGGGGGESLWEPYDSGGITPKNGKEVVLGDNDITTMLSPSFIVVGATGGVTRALNAQPIQNPEDVISLCDLDTQTYFTLTETTHQIQLRQPPLWEVDEITSYIRPKSSKFIRVYDANAGQTVVTGGSVVASKGSQSRNLHHRPLTNNVDVTSLGDFDTAHFKLYKASADTSRIQLQNGPPTYYVPYNWVDSQTGGQDISARLMMTPTSITVEEKKNFITIHFSPDLAHSPFAKTPSQFGHVLWSINVTYDDESEETFNWNYTTKPMEHLTIIYYLTAESPYMYITVTKDEKIVANAGQFRLLDTGVFPVYV